MAHSSEMRWAEAAQKVANAASLTIDSLNIAENSYQELLEVYNYAGGTDQTMADMLFEVPTADAGQVAMVADLRLCITALHELYQALNNVTITQADRAALLRRMS